jgi:hypothetical protein
MYFYSHEPNEPPHIHVDRDDQSANSGWTLSRSLETWDLARRILRLIVENRNLLLEKWYERFPS